MLKSPLDLANLTIAIWNNSVELKMPIPKGLLDLDPSGLPLGIRLDYLWVASKCVSDQEAISLLREVLIGQSNRECWPEAALAGVQLVHALAASGQLGQARQAATDLCSLVFKLEENEVASNCIAELIKAALSQAPTLASAADYCSSKLETAFA